MHSQAEDISRLNRPQATTAVGQWRIFIGIFQGLAAWALLKSVPPTLVGLTSPDSTRAQYWSSQHPMLFAALALMTAYVPVIAILEIGRMRRASFTRYSVVACALIGALAAYDIWRDPFQAFGAEGKARIWPSFAASFCTAIGVFIVNQLLEHRERGHSLFEHYADYFEDSWMRGFQLAVSLVFSLLVWGLLELGAALFGLIHIDWFRTIINHNWFRCPALAAAFAAAIHITDVRPALLKGVRNVGLTLLSWLLPLVIALGAGFLIALLFVGLKPLFETRHAASILLWACAISILLLNAAYKDGDPSALPPAVLRWTGRMGGPTILLLAILAAYAIALRVSQHGWTPDRVFSGAVVTMALVYGVGYAVASTGQSGWLTAIEKVNVVASFVLLGILSLMLSPVMDPARVSVSSQLQRLATSKVPPAQFDYQFLRFDSGRFGNQALEQLVRGQNQEVRSRAALMQQAKVRQFYPQGHIEPAATEVAFAHAAIYPKGTQLPDSFRSADISTVGQYGLNCLHNGGPCEIYVITDLIQAGITLVVRPEGTNPQSKQNNLPVSGQVFHLNEVGKWVNTGSINHLECPGVAEALREGRLTPVRPEHDDLLVNGLRLQFIPSFIGERACIKAVAPAPVNTLQDPGAPAHMGPAFGRPGGM